MAQGIPLRRNRAGAPVLFLPPCSVASDRATRRTTLDWIVEVGATDDAADLRTTLRVPFVIK
jgi:hypothetical protein